MVTDHRSQSCCLLSTGNESRHERVNVRSDNLGGRIRTVSCMDFTALHQALGREPALITDDMLDEAVACDVEEADGLDWKSELPEEKDLARSDVVKDIAAMANSGGGLIVFGVTETQGGATGRMDVGEVTESYERTLRRVAVSGIQPPVFGLGVRRLGEEPKRALAVVVPESVDGPHLVYRGEYFGAPVRNHADTEWMKERQIEAAYRARFEDRQAADRALAAMYDEIAAGHTSAERAWMLGVVRPRLPRVGHKRMTRDEARAVFGEAHRIAPGYADTKGRHPIESVDVHNPRPGLRRWVAPTTTTERPTSAWKAAGAAVHDDGSVTLAAAVGAAPSRDGNGHEPAWLVHSDRAERFVADLMALLRASSNHCGVGEFELRIGIEWSGEQSLSIQTTDQFGFPFPEASIPLARYTPVMATVRTDVDNDGFKGQIWNLATDVVNQGGIEYLKTLRPPQ